MTLVKTTKRDRAPNLSEDSLARCAPARIDRSARASAKTRKAVRQREAATAECSPGTRLMRRPAIVSGMLLALAGISACTPALLGQGERQATCRIVVEEQFEAIATQANPAANPVGGSLVGAGSAALIALGIIGLNPFAVLQGAVGVAAGLGCGAAGAAHPNAETDFREVVAMADRHALKRALEERILAPRAACPNVPEGAAAPPDTAIQIDSIVFTMGCPTGRQTYYIAVKWRAMSPTSREMLSETTTRCLQVSPMDVEAWLADTERARVEVDGALARTGQRIAAELLGADKWTDCTFRPEEPGAAGPR